MTIDIRTATITIGNTKENIIILITGKYINLHITPKKHIKIATSKIYKDGFNVFSILNFYF